MTSQRGDGTSRVSPWNIANALTALRLFIVPFFGYTLLVEDGGDPQMRWWAFALFTMAMVTDKLDGDLARRYGLVTAFGKIADPIADKAITGMGLVGLSLLGELWWWVTIVILVREWGITVMRLRAAHTHVQAADRGGKAKTMAQALAIGLLVTPLGGPVHLLGYVLVAIALVLTVVTGTHYVLALRRASRGHG